MFASQALSLSCGIRMTRPVISSGRGRAQTLDRDLPFVLVAVSAAETDDAVRVAASLPLMTVSGTKRISPRAIQMEGDLIVVLARQSKSMAEHRDEQEWHKSAKKASHRVRRRDAGSSYSVDFRSVYWTWAWFQLALERRRVQNAGRVRWLAYPNATAVERALSILECLDSSRRGLNISEISRKLEIPKSSRT